MNTSVWLCEDGHQFAISDQAFRDAVVHPQCGIVRDGRVCERRLITLVGNLAAGTAPLEPPEERVAEQEAYDWWRSQQ